MALAKLEKKIRTIDTRKGASLATERIRGYRLTGIRQRISLRDDYVCQTCGRVTAQGQVDHITPLCVGGSESDENRQWLCVECHDLKSAGEEKGRS